MVANLTFCSFSRNKPVEVRLGLSRSAGCCNHCRLPEHGRKTQIREGLRRVVVTSSNPVRLCSQGNLFPTEFFFFFFPATFSLFTFRPSVLSNSRHAVKKSDKREHDDVEKYCSVVLRIALMRACLELCCFTTRIDFHTAATTLQR